MKGGSAENEGLVLRRTESDRGRDDNSEISRRKIIFTPYIDFYLTQ